MKDMLKDLPSPVTSPNFSVFILSYLNEYKSCDSISQQVFLEGKKLCLMYWKMGINDLILLSFIYATLDQAISSSVTLCPLINKKRRYKIFCIQPSGN